MNRLYNRVVLEVLTKRIPILAGSGLVNQILYTFEPK